MRSVVVPFYSQGKPRLRKGGDPPRAPQLELVGRVRSQVILLPDRVLLCVLSTALCVGPQAQWLLSKALPGQLSVAKSFSLLEVGGDC